MQKNRQQSAHQDEMSAFQAEDDGTGERAPAVQSLAQHLRAQDIFSPSASKYSAACGARLTPKSRVIEGSLQSAKGADALVQRGGARRLGEAAPGTQSSSGAVHIASGTENRLTPHP